MGCFFELIFEIIFEAILEGWLALMMRIVPKNVNNKVRNTIKTIIGIFAFLLFLCMLIGFCALISEDEFSKSIGKYLFFIPIALGNIPIIITIIRRTKKSTSDEE